MLTMTRLPCDSFLPSGGLDAFDRSIPPFSPDHRPDAVISPLRLPNSLSLDSLHASTNIRLPPTSFTPASSLAVPSTSQQHPSFKQGISTPSRVPSSSVASPSMAPIHSGAMSPSGHLSPQTTAALLQRKEQYIRKLHENWQAERAHREADRARTDEMFHEERDMMDQERLDWIEEKRTVENEIVEWKQRAATAEAKVAELAKLLENKDNAAGKSAAFIDGTVERRTGSSRSVSASPSSLPPAGSTIPESNPFVPLDPRMQSVSPSKTAARPCDEQVPSIDIHEVIPGLEGVRLRAPAVQKPTFNDSKPTSPAGTSAKGSPLDMATSLNEPQPKASPAVRVQDVLRAPAHHRLTMHAGHTPSHSISQVPTIESTAIHTAVSSGSSTPKIHGDLQMVPVDTIEIQSEPPVISNLDQKESEPLGDDGDATELEEAIFEPSENDPTLKGPLCLRNRPAADAPFLRTLSDKLEAIRAAGGATPSVLSELADPDPDREDAKEEPVVPEPDIELKLRPSNNFGQPLGQVGRTSEF
ncbi:hypothetical protein F4808DRAFT_38730 [Astrocystis sublimbata]|nr:hypothetical protein F4808DRAFT_38730 [Astrocystis sublimbata]